MHQLSLQLLQPCLGLPSRGEIADEAGEEPLMASLRFSDGQFHREGRAVLALPDDDAANSYNSPLSRAHVTVEVSVVFVAIRLRHQQFDVLSYDVHSSHIRTTVQLQC